jgi:CRISPR-associated protein Csb2
MYARPANCFASPPSLQPHRAALAQSRHTVARFVLDVARGRRPLPLVTDSLPVGEQVRSALLSICKGIALRRTSDLAGSALWKSASAFWGKDEEGMPRKGHEHAFFLPSDEDRDGRIDHVTIVAQQGFSPDEIAALHKLTSLAWGEDELRLMLIGLGCPHQVRSSLFRWARRWRSATPFVATRFPKLSGRKRDLPEDLATPQAFVKSALRRELERLQQQRPSFGAVESIELRPACGQDERWRSIQFKKFRRKYGDDGGRRPSGAFRVTFAEPVMGPICLGHSSHFGLGLFLPDEEATA